MKTLAILSQKGGAGKTTLALHLAVEAAGKGKRVVILDMDPQSSASDWWRTREADSPELVPDVGAGNLKAVLKAASADGVDLAIIDTPPAVQGGALEAATRSDLSLIVLRPSILDLRAVSATVEIVKRAKARAMVALNAAPVGRGSENPIVIETRSALDGFGFPVAETVMRDRRAYMTALIDGRAVRELEPKGKAAREITALWKEIAKMLEMKP
jgi:chromosome partitioning protein